MVERRKRFEEAGDLEAVKRLELGQFICTMRLLVSKKYTQGQAAKRAGISRVKWNQIENGHVMPTAANIPGMADALKIDPVVLFKRAGLAIPPDLAVYDKKKAFRDLETALDESESLVEFFISMEIIWQSYQFQQLGVTQQTIIEPNFAAAVAFVLRHLSKAQRLQLAVALVRNANHQDVEAAGINYQRFYDSIDTLLKTLRSNKESRIE